MKEPWDNSLKSFISENPQDFTSWLTSDAIFVKKLRTEFQKRSLEADALLEVERGQQRFLLHVEFQSTNDPEMPERLLEYAFEARREHKLPVYSWVIYLRQNGTVPSSPLRWQVPEGPENLQFHYGVVELPKIPTEEFRKMNLTGIMPLLLLTKEGATQTVVDDVIENIQASEKYDLLPITKLLASLVFKQEQDQKWLERRFAMLQDILRDTPAYQRILEEGREEAREEERAKSVKREQQTLQDMLDARFSSIASTARPLIEKMDDPDKLNMLVRKLLFVNQSEEAYKLILDAAKDKE